MAHNLPDALRVFAERYRESQAGRTGIGASDFTLDYQKFLKAAHATTAEARIHIEQQLRRAAAGSGSHLVMETHPRDENILLLLRLKRDGGEAWLFQYLGQPSPTQERRQLASVFAEAQNAALPERWQTAWQPWCSALANKAECGDSIAPFQRSDLAATRELLQVLVRVLNWQGQSLIRFASCVICGNSKRLETLRPRLEQALTQLSADSVTSLEDLGLLEKPRQVLLHGPLRLGDLDLAALRGPFSLSETDLRAACDLHSAANRVLTVENETTFLELAKRNRDTLLIQTSYPNRAVLALLQRLPAELPVFHFGDTDPAGFDILRDLRQRTGRRIQPLHMAYRPHPDSPILSAEEKTHLTRLLGDPSMADCREPLEAMRKAGTKGDYEQESLGPPELEGWPFYGQQRMGGKRCEPSGATCSVAGGDSPLGE
jgi:hypothetical protein